MRWDRRAIIGVASVIVIILVQHWVQSGYIGAQHAVVRARIGLRRRRTVEAADYLANKVYPTPLGYHDAYLDAFNVCPYGLLLRREKSPLNAVPPSQRKMVSVPKSRRPLRRDLSETQQQGFPIKTIIQVARFDEVPEGMFAAMESIREMNPDFAHRYFSYPRARKYVSKHGEVIRIRNVDVNVTTLLENHTDTTLFGGIFGMYYLLRNGGVYVDAAYLPGEYTARATLSEILEDVTFAGLISRRTRHVDFGFMAAGVKGHALIADTLLHLWRKRRGYEEELKAYVQRVAGQASSEAEKASIEFGIHYPLLMATGSAVWFMLQPRSECPWSNVWSSNAVLPGKRSIHFFRTAYPTYHREMSWYDTKDECTIQFWIDLDQRWTWPMGAFHPRAVDPAVLNLPDQKIPRRIMQTSSRDDVPLHMRRAMERVMRLNPEYEHHYFSDRRIRGFMQEHFDTQVLKAFDDLIPGAFKADLFRLAWLYVEGGVYLDGDIDVKQPLRSIVDPNDDFFSAQDVEPDWIYNAVFAATPRHPLIKKALFGSVDKIIKRYYGDSPLAITGPVHLGEVWNASTGGAALAVGISNMPNDLGQVHFLKHHYGRPGSCYLGVMTTANHGEGGVVAFATPYRNYKTEMFWYRQKQDYGLLWKQFEVYRDGNPATTNSSHHSIY